MKRFLTLLLASALIFTSCGKQEEDSGASSEAAAEKSGESEKTSDEAENKSGSEGSQNSTSGNNGAVGHEGEIASENDSAEDAFEDFFACYANSETADSVTKDKQVEFVLYPDSDSPYDMNFDTYIKKVKNGDEYDANIILNDDVGGSSSQWVSVYTDGYLYYEYDGGLYKEKFENWDEVRKAYDGYYFSLVDYTVNGVHVTNYKDGYKKVEFSFDLTKLAEAPDEYIFEILSITGSTWEKLSFNEATFEGYVSPDGYVTSYVMYYDGQVAPGDGTDKYDFKYRTVTTFSDINNTTVDLPDNKDDYTLVEVPEEETEALN